MISRNHRVGAAAAVLALAITACGGGDGGDDLSPAQQDERAEAIDELIADGVERDNAECFVDTILDEFGTEVFETDEDPSNDEAQKIFGIMDDCGIEISDLGS